MIEPANQGLRFLLEMAGLVAVGYWGYQQSDSGVRWLLMLVPPIVLATLWAVFRVPGDGGDPVVAVSGGVRLMLEIGVFGAATIALISAGQRTLAVLFLAALLIHYGLELERLRWLLRQ